MKAIASLTSAAMLLTATTAFAASGAENDGMGLMTILFLGFGALVISFQLVPAAIVLFSMFKGVVSKRDTPVEARTKGN